MSVSLIVHFCTYSREISNMFPDLTKTLTLDFLMDTIFQTLHDYNFARGLAVHTRFDDLECISRSQVCEILKLQIVFRFLSAVV